MATTLRGFTRRARASVDPQRAPARDHRRHAAIARRPRRSGTLETAGARRRDTQLAELVLAAGHRTTQAWGVGRTGAVGNERNRGAARTGVRVVEQRLRRLPRSAPPTDRGR